MTVLFSSLLRWLVLALAVGAAGCGSQPAAPDGPPAGRAFYYWRTTFALTPVEVRALAELHVDRLYLRMFDVAWDDALNAPSVLGAVALTPGARVPAGVEVVPVVFLRDAVFRHLGTDGSAALARRTWEQVKARTAALGAAPRELQVDCDWTDSSRDSYFEFVRALRAESHLALSATIRLHQVKYRERTGIPPIDRGMLMFYNMGQIAADPAARAIFDPARAQKYLARVRDYPLPLDVALPIWSWTVHLRDDRVEGLLQSTDPDELAALPFLRRTASDHYVATRTAFLHGTLLREGDVLKVEVTGPDQALAAAAMIAPRLARTPAGGPARTLSLFELSERNLTRHGHDHLEQLFRAVR